MKIIGIIGSRSRDAEKDFVLTEKAFLDVYQPGDAICSGLCPKGGDRFAVILVDKYDALPIWFPAKWDDLDAPGARIRYNKRGKPYNANAGFERDTDIALCSDILIACIAVGGSVGTDDTIRKWEKFHPGGKVILV